MFVHSLSKYLLTVTHDPGTRSTSVNKTNKIPDLTELPFWWKGDMINKISKSWSLEDDKTEEGLGSAGVWGGLQF